MDLDCSLLKEETPELLLQTAFMKQFIVKESFQGTAIEIFKERSAKNKQFRYEKSIIQQDTIFLKSLNFGEICFKNAKTKNNRKWIFLSDFCQKEANF